MDYLRQTRHLSDEALRKFQFGYCPREIDHELRGRIIMPLFDTYGELVAITSRDFQAQKSFQHWHESFDKGRYLYGLNLSKERIRQTDKAILVEGQFDTACFHSNGLSLTVGILGTALTILHICLLARYCSEMYLMLDPDEGGQKAVERAMTMAMQYRLEGFGIRLIPCELPSDPDDFVVKYGSRAVVDLMKQSREKIINA